jgi:membrane protease subunit HflK
MRIDHLAYQRATNIAGFGFLLQLAAAVVLLIFGMRAGDEAAWFSSFYLFTGLLVWLGLVIVFNQHKLERLEALEEGELTETAAGTSIFDRSGDEIRVAARRLRMMYKWILPLISLIFALVLVLLAWVLFRSLASPARAGLPDLIFMTSNKGWLIAVSLGLSVICFIVSRYLAGMAGQKVWQNLRAGSGVLVGSALVLLAIAAGTIARYFEITEVIQIVAWSIPVFMCGVAAEVVLNLLLNLYRPRVSGEYPRAAFDSRALSLLATPDSFVRSLNDAVNYQFGFDITSSWGYQLVLRSGAGLCVLGLIILLSLSTISVVGGREQGLRLRSGALIGSGAAAVHEPGLFWKLPWPLETTAVYDISSIRPLPLTPMDTTRRAGFLWEDELPLPPGVKLDPFIVRRSRLEVDPEGVVKIERDVQAATSDDSSGDYALVDMLIQLEYRILVEADGEPGLLRYLQFGTETYAFNKRTSERERAWRALALSVVTRYMSTQTLDDVLSDHRANLSGELLKLIQDIFDVHQVGIEVVMVDIPLVRPAGEAAVGFQDLPLAMQQRDQVVARAQRSRTSLFTAIVGDPDMVSAIEDSIDTVDNARFERDRLLREHGKDAAVTVAADKKFRERVVEAEALLFKGGGQASTIVDLAERDRWVEIMNNRSKAGRVQSQVAAFHAAPELYRQRAIMQAYVNGLSGLRKYIVGIPPERMNVNVELRDLAAPNTVFEGVLEGENISP